MLAPTLRIILLSGSLLILTLVALPKFRSSRARRAYFERLKSLPDQYDERTRLLIHSAKQYPESSLRLEKKGHKLPD
jgi:hypothetical protein